MSQVNTESYFLSKTYESYVKASFPTTILPEKANVGTYHAKGILATVNSQLTGVAQPG